MQRDFKKHKLSLLKNECAIKKNKKKFGYDLVAVRRCGEFTSLQQYIFLARRKEFLLRNCKADAIPLYIKKYALLQQINVLNSQLDYQRPWRMLKITEGNLHSINQFY